MILLKLLLLFSTLMLIGTLLTLALFKFNLSKFRRSELSKKILVWIPIFLVFIFFVFSNDVLKSIGLCILVAAILSEYFHVRKKLSGNQSFFIFYIICFLIALLHLPLLKLVQSNITNILLTLGLASAISDVTAFFFGRYFGIHKLPSFINHQKSWEGVLGQVVGALIGILLIKLFVLNDANALLFLPIGLGSAIGDILNSYVKRKVKLVNWSNFIPEHGGFIDRFSSLIFSSFLTFYFLLAINAFAMI